MRLLFSILLSIAALTLGNNAAAQMTVERYLAISRGEVEGIPPDSVLPYLIGALDAAIMMAEIATLEGAAIFCVPETFDDDIDVVDFQAALDSMLLELEGNLDGFAELASSRSVGLATVQLLADVFPCERE